MKRKQLIASLLAVLLLLGLSVSAAADSVFSDVPEDAWYAEAVEYCHRQGLVEGVGDGLFQPQGGVSRAMVVTVLYRLAGAPQLRQSEKGFSDVQEGAWYYAPVAWAVEAELVQGYEDGRFAPDRAITREELATLLWRFAGYPPVRGESAAFADEKEISSYALEAVSWAKAAEVVDGMGDNRFEPRSGANRAQLAAILMKYTASVGYGAGVQSEMDVFCAPTGIIRTGDGALLVTDTLGQKIWRLQDGVTELYAGAETPKDRSGKEVGGYVDSSLTESCFSSPWGIAPFLKGWAVSDAGNHVIRYLSEEGVQTVNYTAVDNSGQLAYPTGLAADGDGNLYVSDTHNGAIRRITPEGRMTTVASGLEDPTGLCWFEGALYVAETGQNRILRLRDGETEVLAGSGEAGDADGPAAEATFSSPQGLTVAPDGTVYISDTVNAAIRVLRPEGTVETLLRTEEDGMEGYPVSPTGLTLAGGRLYICDPYACKLFSLPLA